MRTHGLSREALLNPRSRPESEPRRHGSPIVPISKSRYAMSCVSAPTNKMSTFSFEPRQGQPERITPLRGENMRRLHIRPFLVTCLLTLSLFFVPTAAVQLAAFDNCLPDTYRDREPVPLQLVPLYVDAVFDTQNHSHGLRVTAWGNVTGSYSADGVPPAGDPAWTSPDYTDGKILQEPERSLGRATTLITKVNVLTYEPFYNKVDFCKDGLINATCPLAPIFDTTAL